MHRLDHSINFSRIVAIDLGKFHSVVCLYDPATTEHSFLTIQTTPACVHDLLVQHGGEDPSQVLVVFETCDCGGWESSGRRLRLSHSHANCWLHSGRCCAMGAAGVIRINRAREQKARSAEYRRRVWGSPPEDTSRKRQFLLWWG
jgi:hypothetical protein